MKYALTLIPAIAMALAFAGCQSSSSSIDDKTYPIKGKVVSVDVAAKEVKIDHEDIPGLMKAMTMTFSVDDAKVLDGISAGSQVEGKVKHIGSRYVITELKVRGGSAEQKKIREALAKLSPEDRAVAEAQRTCPASGEPLGSMDVPVKLTLKGKPVFICCKGCKDEVEKDPDATLEKIADAKK